MLFIFLVRLLLSILTLVFMTTIMRKKMLNVIIACEESQTMCTAFRARGCRAFSFDLQKCSGNHPEWHVIGDVTPFINNGSPHRFRTVDGKYHVIPSWDLMIAHPPCTYLSRAGAYLLCPDSSHYDKTRFALMLSGRDFFLKFYNSNIPYIAIENPLPTKKAHLPRPTCFVEPYHFGDPYSKRTLFWLKNLPPLMSTILTDHVPYIGHGVISGSKKRSKSFPGIASACADQWLDFIKNDRLPK